MAKYRLTGPDGSTYDVEAPDTASQDEVMRMFSGIVGQQQRPNVSQMESFGRGALQGATFGFGDEIWAGVKGAGSALSGGSFGETYNREVEAVRAANERARQANPMTYVGGEVAGGFAVPGVGVIGGAARGVRTTANAATWGSRAVRGAKAGAVAGGVYGLGTAKGGDGSVAEQAGNRIAQALPSAVLGGAVGAAAPAVVDVGTNLVKGIAAPLRAALNPVGTAQNKVAEAVMRDFGDRAPVGNILRTVNQKLARAQATKPDAMLADVGGQNTRDLLRSATNLPSVAASRLQRTLDRRQGFQWSRIEKDVADTLADGNSFGPTMQKLQTTLKETGEREFQRSAYVQPMTQAAFRDVADFVAQRGYMARIGQKAADSVKGMTGEDLSSLRPWEMLHRIKMEIDREIGRMKRGQTDSAANWTLRDLVALKKDFVAVLSRHNKPFGQALTKYGDEASLVTALERGADDFAGMSAGELRAAMNGMTEAERRVFRLGAARSLFDRIEKGNVTRDRTDAVFSSPEIMKKLRAIYPDSASFNDLRRRLVIEAKMADTRKAVQGNSTTARQLAQGQEAGQPVRMISAIGNAAAGRFAPVLDYIGRGVQAFHGMTPAVANDVIEAMMQKGALGTQQQLRQALDRAAREPAFREQLTNRFIRAAAAYQAAYQPQN